MKLSSIVPAPAAIAKEAIIVIGGALLAALVIGQLPGVRDWIKAQWSDAPH